MLTLISHRNYIFHFACDIFSSHDVICCDNYVLTNGYCKGILKFKRNKKIIDSLSK